MHLYGLAERMKATDLALTATTRAIAELMQQIYPGQSFNGSSQLHWESIAQQWRQRIFLGRTEENGQIVALGCMAIYGTMRKLIAHIGEVVVDKRYRDDSTTRFLLGRLMAEAGHPFQVDEIFLDDRICLAKPAILKEMGFKRDKETSHTWQMTPPTEEDE